jgi:hypothetical protein
MKQVPTHITLLSWTGWHTPVIPALRRLRQEDHEFKCSLAYIWTLSQNKTKRITRSKGKQELFKWTVWVP